MTNTVTVPLGERSYPICVGDGVLDQAASLLRTQLPGTRILLVADETVDGLYGDRVAALFSDAGFTLARATVPAGEASKSGEWLLRLYERAADEVLDRKSAIVALGGGVVGDLAGFLAASYLRGIRLVQIPTTLLAMVDSAVGGKTGINLPQGKNLVGAFHQPVLVLCDIGVLKTLPARELAAGLAEVIKYGVIRDAELFAYLERELDAIRAGDPAALAHIVARSCAIKADVVSADEHEAGERAILNFGHTLGHAVEQVAGYGAYLHGEAVGIGMAYAARVSVQAAGLSREDESRIVRLIQRAGLPVEAPGLAWPDLRRAMAVDKKGAAGVPRFVLAKRIGAVEYGCAVPEATLEEAWHGGR
ncbi:MAG TPA: 3-dehydroquinate synthase [Kiritimatiellia bacterium]|nr:3-dehydroquinate synthase [Kiritimatiellia bacterium]